AGLAQLRTASPFAGPASALRGAEGAPLGAALAITCVPVNASSAATATVTARRVEVVTKCPASIPMVESPILGRAGRITPMRLRPRNGVRAPGGGPARGSAGSAAVVRAVGVDLLPQLAQLVAIRVGGRAGRGRGGHRRLRGRRELGLAGRRLGGGGRRGRLR